MGRAVRVAMAGVLPALLLGCQKHERPAEYGGAGMERDDVPSMETPTFGGGGLVAEDAPGVVPAAVEDFRKLADGFDDVAPDPRHVAMVRAFQAMAQAFDALPDVPAEARASAHEIRNAAQRIQTSGAESMKHAEWARQALVEAADALDAVARTDAELERLSGRAQDVRQAAGKLVLDKPLLGQEEIVFDALEDVADAMVWSIRRGDEDAAADGA